MEDWREIYEKESGFIFKFIYGAVQNKNDSEDILQETFYRAMKRGKKNIKNVRGYLLRIARNIIYDSWKSRRRMTEYIKEEKRVDTYHPEDIETKIEIQKSIKKLHPDFRTVFVLREINGMSYEEIAVALRLPVGTVKSRLNRARLALRGTLRRKVEL